MIAPCQFTHIAPCILCFGKEAQHNSAASCPEDVGDGQLLTTETRLRLPPKSFHHALLEGQRPASRLPTPQRCPMDPGPEPARPKAARPNDDDAHSAPGRRPNTAPSLVVRCVTNLPNPTAGAVRHIVPPSIMGTPGPVPRANSNGMRPKGHSPLRLQWDGPCTSSRQLKHMVQTATAACHCVRSCHLDSGAPPATPILGNQPNRSSEPRPTRAPIACRTF